MTNEPQDVVEGVLERVVFVNPDDAWSVVRIREAEREELTTAVGNLLEVRPGESLRLEGQWVEDPRFGRQLRVSSYTTIKPSTIVGIEKYLASGLIKGIGPKMAKRLVERFGEDTLDIIAEHPERLARVPGIGPKRRAEIRKAWLEQRNLQELMVFLQGHGVSPGLVVKIARTYGDDALAVVQQDPYRLAREIFGVGFKTADTLAAGLGMPLTSLRRAEAGILHLLDRAAERGHVFLPRTQLLESAQELLREDPPETGPRREFPSDLLEEAIRHLARSGYAVVEEPPEAADPAVYSRFLHSAEVGLAQGLLALRDDAAPPPEIDLDKALVWLEARQRLELAPEQREAIRRGLSSKVLVITGGPGTGKTTLVRGIVEILAQKDQRVLLAAPTGRAAKRLGEATGREARTLHRLLEFNPQLRHFERGPERPLHADLVILDEVSMLDVVLAYHTVGAIPPGCRLVMVGDVDQLPSVGPGRVLGDLIDSGAVDVVRLTHIFRQGEHSRIVLNAHRIRQGEMPLIDPGDGQGDFFFIERDDPAKLVETLLHLVSERIPGGFSLDPLEDIQVLTPMNRGPLGTEVLNHELRRLLNPEGPELARGGRRLRLGDKVMQVRNNYDLNVFNGDLGRVAQVETEEPALEVDFDGRRVRYEPGNLDELVLAYACTIHKSQGSEYPCVVIPLHGQHYVMLQRNLLYTAVTRAKRLVVLVGQRKALATAVRNQRTGQRHTRLIERLRTQRAREQAPGLWD